MGSLGEGSVWFVRGIGAVVLWVDCRWNRCGEPSQALRASSPGGRAKGAVDIGRRRERQGCGGCRGRDSFRFMGLFAMNDLSNSVISCRGDAMSSPGAV